MCGVAGIIGRVSDTNRQAIRRMAKAIAHRGPDDERFFEKAIDAEGNGVLFAHRRLSILDLSEAGAQPMTDAASGRHTIVYNGEIYNYVELRDRMQSKGEAFKSSGDTEVMLRLLATEGAEAARDFRGMFAFALWDGAQHEVVLGRDPMGMKPLYICRNPDASAGRGWSVIFASEVRAILASGLLDAPRLDPAAVASFIWNGFIVGPQTIVRGISLLPPGAILRLDCAGRDKHLTTVAALPAANVRKDAHVSDVRAALHDSVRLHLASDVPLGVFLSGGIDSSSIANMAAKQSGSQITTFTLSFDEQEYDEGPFARKIAEAIGTRHQEVRFTEDHFLGSLEQGLASVDQPTFDGLNSFYISQAVREAGIKVALLGSGGDELFGGYRTFSDLPRFQSMARLIAWLPQLMQVTGARAVAKLLDRSHDGIGAQARWAKLPNMVAASADIVQLYQLAYALFLPDFQERLLGEGRDSGIVTDGLSLSLQAELREQVGGRSAVAALGLLEQRMFLGERLLRDTDVASMAVSLETRLPLVDRTVADVVARLPDAVRFEPLGRKQLLRDVGLEGLDPALFERPKRGFQMPFDRWIRRRLGKEMEGVMGDTKLADSLGLDGRVIVKLWRSYQAGGGVFWSRVWAIYVLLRWCQNNNLRAC